MGEEKRLVDTEYAGAALGDQRLNSRLQKIAGTLEANPEVGFPHAMT
ncbi:MAG: transposase DNA-binding-containing protein, partial [Deltaproteobacteria bacterium]